jgi:hypothetical protein
MTKALAVFAFVIGGVLIAAGGPIMWAVLVMVGVPMITLFLAGSAGHEGEHPHFAPPNSRS